MEKERERNREREEKEKEERKKTKYLCIKCCCQSLRLYSSINEQKENTYKFTNVFHLWCEGHRFRFATRSHKGQIDHFFLSSCSWENKTIETDAIQFQVYSLDHVTAHEILFIQSQHTARVIYTVRVFALKSIAEKPWIKTFPLLSIVIDLTYSPWNSGQRRFILWSPYYIISPL